MPRHTFIKHVPEDPNGLLFHLCLREDDGGEVLMLRSRDEMKLQPLIDHRRGDKREQGGQGVGGTPRPLDVGA